MCNMVTRLISPENNFKTSRFLSSFIYSHEPGVRLSDESLIRIWDNINSNLRDFVLWEDYGPQIRVWKQSGSWGYYGGPSNRETTLLIDGGFVKAFQMFDEVGFSQQSRIVLSHKTPQGHDMMLEQMIIPFVEGGEKQRCYQRDR